MNNGDIVTLYVAFTQGRGGKRRPVFIIEREDGKVRFFPITSQYENKSESIKRKYVEIQDWVETGLKKRSWIDSGTVKEIPEDSIQWRKVGILSDRDLRNLENHLMDRNKESSGG